MKIEFEKGQNFVHKKYHLYENEIEILSFISEKGGIYFRDLKYGEPNPLDESNTFEYQSCLDLIHHNFLKEEDMTPNYYGLTPLGKFFLADSNTTNRE